MRIARAKSSPRLAPGATARSSHTADACVIVTSLSTPMPASTRPQRNTSDRSALVCVKRICDSSALVPMMRDDEVASHAMPAVSSRPMSVPRSAVVVRVLKPCAR